MARGPDVNAVVEQVKMRLKQIEDQVSRHQRVADELGRVYEAVRELERAVVARVGGGHAAAADQPERAERPAAVKPATAPARTPRGHNKAQILKALEGRDPMTASEIAKVTGIAAATVSTTLNKMAKAGELTKAERGYTLPR